MKISIMMSAVLVVAAGCGDASAPRPVAPISTPSAQPRPATPDASPKKGADRRPVTHEYFGTKVTDDYEWLEDTKSPDVTAFTDAQNEISRRFFDGLPDRPKVRARVSALMSAASTDYVAVKYAAGTLFVEIAQPPKQQPLIVIRNLAGEAASERVILDPNVLDPTGKTAIDWFVPSPDGKLVAISLSKGGTESGDVHVFDVANGKEKDAAHDTIARVNGGTAGGSVAWNETGNGFYYTRYPHAGERPEVDLDFYQQIYFHKLGTAESTDTYALGKEFPRIAEVELERSDDGKAIVAKVANGDGGEFEHHVLFGGKWIRLAKLEDQIVITTFAADGRIFGVSRKIDPMGAIVSWVAPFDKPPVVSIEHPGTAVEDVVVTKNAIYLATIAGGPSLLKRTALDPKPQPLAKEPDPKPKPKAHGFDVKTDKGQHHQTFTPIIGGRGVPYAEVPILPISSVNAIVRVGEDLLVKNESFVDPPTWFRYKADEHRMIKTPMAKAAPADMSDVEVTRTFCKSKDGTNVPMSILRKKTAKLDGTIPALLTGYGGYGVTRKPRLRTWNRVWLDAGGIVADANLRGGSEEGEDWHTKGKLLAKQNVFDDFAACAKALVDLGYTKPEHLAVSGRSNGGLLMGAFLVQHPDMFRAVVSGVGIYDMLRTELSPNGAFNVTEYGTVKNEAQFRAMFAYSPLHNVKDGTAYPSILLSTGANDPRVDPYQSRKMLARLQAASSSAHPILLRASADVGHGMGSPLNAEIDEATDEISFLFHELGVTFSPPVKQ